MRPDLNGYCPHVNGADMSEIDATGGEGPATEPAWWGGGGGVRPGIRPGIGPGIRHKPAFLHGVR